MRARERKTGNKKPNEISVIEFIVIRGELSLKNRMKKVKTLNIFLLILPFMDCATKPKMVARASVPDHSEKIEMICPIDGQRAIAVSKNIGRGNWTALDFRSNGLIDDPGLLPICRKCHFPIYKDKFTVSELKKIKAIVEGDSFKNISRNSVPYAYLARLFELSGESSENIGLVYLKASWQADDSENSFLSTQYKELSLRYYQEVLKGDSTSLDVRYKAIELLRRLGDFTQAIALINSSRSFELEKDKTYFLDFEKCLVSNMDSQNHFLWEKNQCSSKN